MKNELELKHIAGYLPYGLKMKCYNWEFELFGIVNDTITLEDEQGNYEEYELNAWKPILRPLSDLTKSITHNGETFVPIVELAKISINKDEKWQVVNKLFGASATNHDYDFWYVNQSFYTNKLNIDIETNYQLQLFEKLYEWHFDIHSLIEQGLAIDLNTI